MPQISQHCRRYLNVSRGRGLVKMSTIYSFVPMYSTLILFSTTKENDIWQEYIQSWSASQHSVRALWCCCCHNISKWAHLTSLEYPLEFSSSKELGDNMLLMLCIFLLLQTRIVKIVSFSTMIRDNHPSRRLRHLFFFSQQHYLPNLPFLEN